MRARRSTDPLLALAAAGSLAAVAGHASARERVDPALAGRRRSGASPAGTREGGHHADVDGLRMYYEIHGRGRPLVLLHGGGSTIQTSFGAVLPVLARSHRVIAPEQQAHGRTADVDRPLTFEQMADDTAALLRQLGVRGADVLGFSNGGHLALVLALRHPELVGRLVLCSAYSARDGFAPALREGFDHARLSDMPAALREGYLAVAKDPDGLRAQFEKTVAMMKTFPDLPEADLRALRVPALVMAGDHDVVLLEHEVRLAQLLPDARLAVLPDARHGEYLGTAEAPKPRPALLEASLGLIEDFLGGARPARARPAAARPR
jgi:pimeloyl-ACP methyl ester carboxylesterase